MTLIDMIETFDLLEIDEIYQEVNICAATFDMQLLEWIVLAVR